MLPPPGVRVEAPDAGPGGLDASVPVDAAMGTPETLPAYEHSVFTWAVEHHEANRDRRPDLPPELVERFRELCERVFGSTAQAAIAIARTEILLRELDSVGHG